MSIYSDLKNNIYQASTQLMNQMGFTENKLIWQYGNGPEPTEDYGAMYIIDINQVGTATESTRTSEVVPGDKELQQIFYTTVHELTVQYTFVGKLSPVIASQWQRELRNNRVVRDNFYANNLSVISMTTVRPISIKRDTLWVDNTTIDVRYRYSCQSSQQVNWVEYIVVDGFQTGPY